MTPFKDFIFGKLPNYYKINDTYKNLDPLSLDRGLLERYLEIFGLELDNNVIPLIQNYLDEIDPTTIDPQYLTTLGYTLGSPPDLSGSSSTYAKLLAYIISVYKIKGTIQAYTLLFALLGYTVTIVESPLPEEIYFDEGFLFDNGGIFDEGCPCCSDFSIIVSALITTGGGCTSPTFASISPSLLPTFEAIVEFNQPINANFIGIVNGGQLCEVVNYCYIEDVNVTVIEVISFDSSLLFDNSEEFDDSVIISSTDYHHDCGGGGSGIGVMVIGSTFIVG